VKQASDAGINGKFADLYERIDPGARKADPAAPLSSWMGIGSEKTLTSGIDCALAS
jgi:hypothetical protein